VKEISRKDAKEEKLIALLGGLSGLACGKDILTQRRQDAKEEILIALLGGR
jgi:hypothetical protein